MTAVIIVLFLCCRVPEGADAELAVSVQGPVEDIPVKVTGNVKNGFIAQFIPNAVGLHVVLVEYNGVAVGGTPFYCKEVVTLVCWIAERNIKPLISLNYLGNISVCLAFVVTARQAYDSDGVSVDQIPKGTAGKTVTFAGRSEAEPAEAAPES